MSLPQKPLLGEHDGREWTYVRKDGKRSTVILVVTASYDTSGTIVGFLGIAMDVTARKKAEDTLTAIVNVRSTVPLSTMPSETKQACSGIYGSP
jgi:hypothetical protein